MTQETFDFIVVGGGLAVIESGQDLRDDPRFKTVPQDGLGGREIKFTQGRLVGGTSALNGLAFSATSRANIDAWENLGNPGWNWVNFSRAMSKSYHSNVGKGNGPVELTVPDEDENQWPRVWRDTLKALGFPINIDPFSGHVCGGLTVPDSLYSSTKRRSYSASAYLESAVDRPNFTLWTQIPAEKILFDQFESDDKSKTTVATGVQYTTPGSKPNFVRANKEVILTAGAINSPKILELSGIGDNSCLDALGIHTVIDNPFVGENLQNHPMCMLNFEVQGNEKGLETMDKLSRQDSDTIAAAMEAYRSRQTGTFSRSSTNHAAQLPLPEIRDPGDKERLRKILQARNLNSRTEKTTEAFAEAHTSFVRSVLESPMEASACYLSVPVFSAYNGDGTRISALQLNDDRQYFTIALLLAHPLSRGSVHITRNSTSASTSDDLAMDPRYLTHSVDIEVLARHLQYASETIAVTDPLRCHLKTGGKHNPTSPIHLGSFADLENVRRYAGATTVGAAHYTGTCSMMPRDMGGVVDHELRVYGCQNLRICDASIISITSRTNPQATVYGVAEMAADIIKSSIQ